MSQNIKPFSNEQVAKTLQSKYRMLINAFFKSPNQQLKAENQEEIEKESVEKLLKFYYAESTPHAHVINFSPNSLL